MDAQVFTEWKERSTYSICMFAEKLLAIVNGQVISWTVYQETCAL